MSEITDLSPTDASNTTFSGEGISGATFMTRTDEVFQVIMGALGRWTDFGSIASASTCAIGAEPEAYLNVTGTTTITAFGTIRNGTMRFLKFADALTLTHNATTLILPGATNITTAAGDTAIFVSEGSGNWRCLAYQRAAQAPISYAEGTFTPTLDGTSAAGSGTYSQQQGRYTKIGREVSFEVNLNWSAHTGTGNIIVSGLPFTSSGAGITAPVSVVASNLTFTGQLIAQVPSNSTQVQIRTVSSGASLGDVAMDTSALLFVAGRYTV